MNKKKGRIVNGTSFIHVDVIEKRKYWTDLIWTMSKSDKTQYDSLRGTEVVEFFQLMKNFEEEVKRKTKSKS